MTTVKGRQNMRQRQRRRELAKLHNGTISPLPVLNRPVGAPPSQQKSCPRTYTLYILDAVPPIHVVSNHVATDKLTTTNGGTFTNSSSASLSTNHVKAQQSLIERFELAEILLIYVLRIFA